MVSNEREGPPQRSQGVRRGEMAWKGILASAAVGVLLAVPAPAMDNMTHGHGDMKGEHGAHDMMKMGDKVFSGKVGPWHADARIMDMKAHMEASGMKTQGAMPNSHHLALSLTDATKKPLSEGKGTVTVTGPDKKVSKSEFMVMQGHFGADVNLPKPGKYTFKTEIEAGGQKGNATFVYTLK
jgi:hypothetical protein